MSESLLLSVPDLADPAERARFFGVADAAAQVDGLDPFNEQSRLDVGSGRRTPFVAFLAQHPGRDRPIGAAILGRGQLDLVIHPRFRGHGHGEDMVQDVLARVDGALAAWSHGDHPAARVLADRHGFGESRRLFKLRLAPIPDVAEGGFARGEASHVRLDRFRPGEDDAEWVALNARVFADLPDQGGLTIDDLRERQREPWFDAGDVIVARTPGGRMIAYDWLKVEPRPDGRDGSGGVSSGPVGPAGSTGPQTDDGEGEIYVLGVHPEFAGLGLGRALMAAGLGRLRERGCRAAVLYVDSANEGAVHLYRSMGFETETTDIQYSRCA